jgi:hypothetical protein
MAGIPEPHIWPGLRYQQERTAGTMLNISKASTFLHMQDKETKDMLGDLIWLNAVIATELIQITENSSAILRQGPPPDSCLTEHNDLRKTALAIAEKYRPGSMLALHLLKHQ